MSSPSAPIVSTIAASVAVAIVLGKKTKTAFVEIMIPLVSTDTELKILRALVKRIAKKIELKNAYAIRGVLKSNIGDAEGACADWQKASENKTRGTCERV